MEHNTIYEFGNFDLIVTQSGALLVSKIKRDFPFVIMNNKIFGLVVIHADEIQYLRFELNYSQLNVKGMVTYTVNFGDLENWVVVIPFQGATLNPRDHIHCDAMRQNKEFEDSDFPAGFEEYPSLAVVTGFYE